MRGWYLVSRLLFSFFFFSSRRRHTRLQGDWSSDVCSSDLPMPDPIPIRPRLVLLADANEWSARSLASILGPSGVQVLQVHAGPEVAAAARTQVSDAILLTESLPETNVAALVRSLREDPDVPPELPIILIGTGPVSRLRLIAALRAGASDMWSLPMDSEELVLRLEALVRLKSAAERAREDGLLDWATGLYNRRGLTLRARDLASQADRRGAALACVVLAPALPGGHAQRDRAAAALQLGAAVDAVVHGLKQAGRSSDAIGRLGRAEFAVLAPDADARGARRLGTRLRRAIARAAPPPSFEHPLRLRAGYHAVRDFHRAALGPLDLLTRATSALRAVQAGRAGGWIRGFKISPGG